jgi:hypothetical protein
LGVKDQENDLRVVTILHHVVTYYGVSPKEEVCLSKRGTFDELEKQIRDTSTAVTPICQGKVLSLGLPCRRSVCKMLGAVLKSELRWYYMNFKWRENCRNGYSVYEIQLFNITYLTYFPYFQRASRRWFPLDENRMAEQTFRCM